VRCAIGDGAVPFREIAEILERHHASLNAVLEPGALDVRHIRFLNPQWWNGYPPATASSLAAALAAAQINRLDDAADYRTPWERGADTELVDYELSMIRRSAANMRELGLMTR
jgi:3-oxoisoapionate decarboxylase